VNTSLVMNVHFPFDLRSAVRFAKFSSKSPKEVNRSLVRNFRRSCDPRPAKSLAIFSSKWAEELNRSLMRNVPSPGNVRSA
jgi:hypothetical protein